MTIILRQRPPGRRVRPPLDEAAERELAEGLAATPEGPLKEALARLGRDYGLVIDPDAIVGELPVGLQQRVEILKALIRGAEVLVLDEPTAVLTPEEADLLFRLLRTLAGGHFETVNALTSYVRVF